MTTCACDGIGHVPRLVVLTGGPGAGKTAALEVLHQLVCPHVAILPEAASILWRGGFPRTGTISARRSAQRLIGRMQLELQHLALEQEGIALVVCDRGTLDGLAFWPGQSAEYFEDLGSTYEQEMSRYAAAIHMRVPHDGGGYDHSNPYRIESAAQAREIDDQIAVIWKDHPRYLVVESDHDFRAKLEAAIKLILTELPACCR